MRHAAGTRRAVDTMQPGDRLDRPATSDATARALVQAIPDLIFRIGVDGRYRGFKAESEAELATDPDHVIGASLADRLPPDVARLILDEGRSAVAGRGVRNIEYDLHVQGEERSYEGRVAACGDDEFLLIVRDFTDRRRQARELERLTAELRERVTELERERDFTFAVVRSIPSFLALVDPEGTLLGVNRALERAGGFPASEWLDRPFWTMFLSPEDAPRAREDFRRMLAGDPPGVVEYEHVSADGERLVVDWIASSATDSAGEPRYILCGVDVTGRKRAEEELRRSRARIVAAADEARKQLERNIHDGAQQHLVSVTHALHLARRFLRDDPDVADAHLERALGDLTGAHEELRELARGLHPVILSQQGLVPAITAVTRRAPFPVSLLKVGDLDGLPESVAGAAYYVVAESLTNVAKYAHATSARVCVVREEGRLVVEVADDGVGGARLGEGSGLQGLCDRVEALDGTLVIDGPAGGGTLVRAEIPLADRAAAGR